jgi:hypothetical protein
MQAFSPKAARLVIVTLLMAATSWAPSAAAQVTLDQWGTYAVTAYSDCAEFCDPLNDLSWILGFTFGPTNSGIGDDLIDSALSNASGDAFSEASVQGGLGPTVRVNADSLPGGFVDGTATAVQGYTYVGLAPDTIEVNARLTGTIGNPDLDPATGLAAQVSYVGDANVAAFVFETAVNGLGAPDGAVQLEQTSGGAVDLVDVLSIPVSPGDQFYLVVSSAATAAGTDAFAESLGTLTITFDANDAANLEAASGPIAVPTSPWAWAALLACLVGAGLRKTSWAQA